MLGLGRDEDGQGACKPPGRREQQDIADDPADADPPVTHRETTGKSGPLSAPSARWTRRRAASRRRWTQQQRRVAHRGDRGRRPRRRCRGSDQPCADHDGNDDDCRGRRAAGAMSGRRETAGRAVVAVLVAAAAAVLIVEEDGADRAEGGGTARSGEGNEEGDEHPQRPRRQQATTASMPSADCVRSGMDPGLRHGRQHGFPERLLQPRRRAVGRATRSLW